MEADRLDAVVLDRLDERGAVFLPVARPRALVPRLLVEALERALREVPLLADDVVRRRELAAPRELVPARAEVRRPLDRLLEVERRLDVRLRPAPLRCEAGISA